MAQKGVKPPKSDQPAPSAIDVEDQVPLSEETEQETLLKKGLTSVEMREAFEELRVQHPEVSIRKIENRDTHALVSLEVPAGTAEAAERTLVSLWETKLLVAQVASRFLERDWTIEKIASAAAAAGVSVDTGDKKVED